MAVRNAVYAQSGGVTAVINATACGLIQEARRHPERIGKVLAGRDGIIGALTEDLIDTSLESDVDVARLRSTPAGAFGSCRYKLKSLEEHRAQYERLIDVFKAHDIGYFFYNGGNDSMDTAWKVSQISEKLGYTVVCVGVPKTVDNDLPLTDCCPGFGSVAKYVATSIREAGYDVASMARTSTRIFVLEVMGRHAGWITAACGLASENAGEPPHILLFPEVPFDPERFLVRVEECIGEYGYCTVAVSEGLADASGKLIAESGTKDAFGHSQLGGVGQVIAQLVKDRLGHKYHWALADYLQRSARHLASRSDVDQAHALGVAAVDFAQQGKKRGDADGEAARGCALSLGNRRCATEGHRQRGAQDAGRVHQRRRLPYHQCLPDLSAAADRRRRFAAFPQRAARSCSSEERHRAKKAGTVQHLIFL